MRSILVTTGFVMLILLLPVVQAISITPGKVTVTEFKPGERFEIPYTLGNKGGDLARIQFYLEDDIWNNQLSDRADLTEEIIILPADGEVQINVSLRIPEVFPVEGRNEIFLAAKGLPPPGQERQVVATVSVRSRIVFPDVPPEYVRPELFLLPENDMQEDQHNTSALEVTRKPETKKKTVWIEKNIVRDYKLYFTLVTAVLIFMLVFVTGYFLIRRLNTKRNETSIRQDH